MRRLLTVVATALAAVLLPAAHARAADELLVNNSGGPGVRLVDTADTAVGLPIGDIRSPHWSPDGTKLIANVGSDVVVMNADGTNRKVAGSGYQGAVFSPDGSSGRVGASRVARSRSASGPSAAAR